ncbi:MAG: hypothetical protein ACOY90_17025 [Candidatus Zhuqueibacterota bacterium]
MLNKKYLLFLQMMAVVLIGILALSCDTGVVESPEPGILRITLQSEAADTTLIVISDTLSVTASDWFGVTITQGKVYNGDNFAILYKDTSSYQIQDITYNILEQENDQYRKFTIYESFVPPGDYDKLQIGVTASLLKLGYFSIPIELPRGASLLIDLNQNFTVFKERRITEVNVQISPFKSVVRYKDSYHFMRMLEIAGVNYPE